VISAPCRIQNAGTKLLGLMLSGRVLQTAAHPRTAILVNTMAHAAGDLWHFLILFVVLNAGFIALGMVRSSLCVCEAVFGLVCVVIEVIISQLRSPESFLF